MILFGFIVFSLTLINGELEEIVAHSGNVNCLSLAKKRRRGLFITGGDDQLVNLWSIGKSAPLVVSFDILEFYVILMFLLFIIINV